MAQWVRSLDLTAHTSLSSIRRGFAPSFVNYKKGWTQLVAASDKVYQLLAQGRWFCPASSTTKTGCHDIAEILLSGFKTPKINNKSNPIHPHIDFNVQNNLTVWWRVTKISFWRNIVQYAFIVKLSLVFISSLTIHVISKTINCYLTT